MNFITLQEYKDFNGIKKPDEDAKNTMLIEMVSNLIKTYLGLNGSEGGDTHTEVISLDYDTDQIFLEHYPIASLISVSETSRYTYDSTVHVPLTYESDFSLNAAEGILFRNYRVGGFAKWPISPGTVTVQYVTAPRWGMGTTTDVPSDLKLAVIELVNYYKDESWKSMTIQGSTRTEVPLPKGFDFPPHIQVILDKYK